MKLKQGFMTLLTTKLKWNILVLLFPMYLIAQTNEIVKKHTEFLASDKLEGRGTGSKGIRLAANYIEKQFKAIGLESAEPGSYLQEFPFPGQDEPETNVVGFVKAASPTKKSIVFTAHYDAYGIKKVEGETDSIYNGAQDNALGVGALIAIASIYASEKAPQHNLVFIATAGEEFGLYGSKFYIENPLFPSDEIIICLNIDGFNISGPREDYFIFPRQGINFVDKIETILKPLGWYYISPDWVDSLNTNFDTASFLQQGIPALTLWTGNRLKGGKTAEPIAFGGIHSPADEITDLWNWEGVEEHILLYRTIADYFLAKPDGIKVTEPKLFVK
ncbi:M28 family peptidase [Muriicola sp. Z0-33]|uniref:M28 family peptidase n=1 Tax=Muriicola sp. Z0-33 TaxID=2816957 RepID=UPI0022382252|nr:M28 family peptidase [Muriicola sp. Z0-33]MCW5515653.1 M28 family peptidase [Muriicola sp. Z0-33]